jgi:hypothetical protein
VSGAGDITAALMASADALDAEKSALTLRAKRDTIASLRVRGYADEAIAEFLQIPLNAAWTGKVT